MLTPELVETLLMPISENAPAGEDLEYDPDFTALESAALGKPEQQFGDTLIAAVEPEWPHVSTQALALLQRSKDLRPAVLLLRAATREQGIAGFSLALQFLTRLLDSHWAHVHPQLDADDDDDATMRLNALAPLADDEMVLRDLYEAAIGTARGVGPITVRDVAIAQNLLTAADTDAAYSPAQLQGGLAEIHADRPALLPLLQGLPAQVAALQQLLSERSGSAQATDLSALRRICSTLRSVSAAVMGDTADAPSTTDEDAADAAGGDAGSGAHRVAAAAPRGEISSRQDAMRMLDRVIRFLETSEPGNPAPLLLERAKSLIGVSFLEIIQNLAPDALDTIANVTGKRPSE